MEHFIVLKFKNTEHRDAFWESTGQHMGNQLVFQDGTITLYPDRRS